MLVITESINHSESEPNIVSYNADPKTVTPEESYSTTNSQMLTIFIEEVDSYLQFINFELQDVNGIELLRKGEDNEQLQPEDTEVSQK